ncbi:putative thioesterase [Botrimarina hoheduenensis]|uniref:Putative thioesterase n=2 Tax=Botrimarina hoheduenensis TaxID=2528000 RepID=A0A5C5VVV0_9BACT|nr:putative thioesterase [Botrimarina hoheduenensis]
MKSIPSSAPAEPNADPVRSALLQRLAQTITDQIPITKSMGFTVESYSAEGLRVSMPLEPNRNPHQTAFAGSLNALCTLAGWGMTNLILGEAGLAGAVVLRRSSIKYREPVNTDHVAALCLPPPEGDLRYFLAMLQEKGQAKLELAVQIEGTDSERPAVLYGGSYVVSQGSRA